MTSASSVHEAGHSKPSLTVNPEGWGEEGVQFGNRDKCAPVAYSCQYMAKTITIM